MCIYNDFIILSNIFFSNFNNKGANPKIIKDINSWFTTQILVA